MKVIIVGGGPAGMMAAIVASREGNEVTLIEKNNILGKKLLITGKGRCNITSSLDMDEFINNIPGNGKFLYSAFKNFSNLDIINFLSSHGLKVKEERGHRYFPVTDNAKDVLDCFTNELKNKQVKIKFNTSIKDIKQINNLQSDILSIGQVLKIPVSTSSLVPTSTISYIVQPGDTLYSIARKYNTTVNTIKNQNNLVGDLLVVGDSLLIS